MSQERATRVRERNAQLRAAAAFVVTILASVAFVVVYVLDAGTQWEGATLATAFLGLAVGMTVWARQLMPDENVAEDRAPDFSPAEEQDALSDQLAGAGVVPPRRGLLALLGLGGASLGVGSLVPAFSLSQPEGHGPERLRHTAWRAGTRLVDSEGRPVRPEQVVTGTFLPVFPEGHLKDGDVPAFAVRLERERIASRPPGPDLDGLVVYSLLCTHAGCPVGLYERGTGKVLCPCHQSVFDLWRGGARASGPADRPLPGLPVEVRADGHLYALGDFTSPPGPGFWSYP